MPMTIASYHWPSQRSASRRRPPGEGGVRASQPQQFRVGQCGHGPVEVLRSRRLEADRLAVQDGLPAERVFAQHLQVGRARLRSPLVAALFDVADQAADQENHRRPPRGGIDLSRFAHQG